MKPDVPPLIDASHEEMLAELETLRGMLAEMEKPDCATDGDGVVIMRLCSGLSLAGWEALCNHQDLRDWLALPLSANPLPYLSRIQETLKELVFLSEHDPLTKLYNRGAFERILSAELIRSSRAGQSLALVLFDLDDFKAINDTYGHPCGDRVLETIGALLLAEKRTYDTAARVGGEEFALILPSVGLVRAAMVIERIVAAVRSLKIVCDGVDTPLCITISAGLAITKGKMATTLDKLYALADGALYEAKSGGKDRIVAAPIADLTSPPERTLVRSDEKRFLFTGLTKG
ncbi:diguanylate cyclase [Solidesulfovibrio carbinoliphilus subsp. oakridgensis]|uniref:diguanylate cyclase n=1 Tax=Solidesulfovibrio carbinoliphilus subsp. oakridgensis TaxID=694327 RepID=G7QDF5_9BACT|nr:GGDEF domain-containing protein [Solidesulfovibrio carbinoliphilus]EHJ46461.1 diguanylate cyclase [Solidesulfovibrio carbinoliphilus subsp. oakridgensis]